jgi:aryl-alcohol dehydrogenase-like predicted oxidoreductase
MIPIPGFKTVEQVMDNAGAMDFGPLTDEELDQVKQIVADYEPQE